MFTLDQVVPWGRSFDEYRWMFALADDDLTSSILGCGDGPASFNAEATRGGVRVVSCDPLYEFTAEQIRQRIEATREAVLEETRRNQEKFVWNDIRDVDELARVRTEAMEKFLADFEAGHAAGRYVNAALPELPFSTRQFDLAIVSHLLFLYSEQLSESFHIQAVRELCRVAHEVRVFPLLTLAGERSPHVTPIRLDLERLGIATQIEAVPYEFQRGGNQMLRIWPLRCNYSPKPGD
jgi:hypothetical protein